MAEDTKVDTDKLRREAPEFAAAADKLKAAFDTLVQEHEAQHAPWKGGKSEGPWGDDDNGKEFAGDYIESRDNCDEGVKNIVNALRNATHELKASADTWDAIDQNAAQNLKDAGSWT